MRKLEKIFKAFADKNRLRILKLLGKRRKMCVCELAFVLNISQPSVSRHLKKLVEAGLIGGTRDALWTDYYLRKDGIYVKTLLINLDNWLGDDGVVLKDLQKAKKADRKKLCCSPR